MSAAVALVEIAADPFGLVHAMNRMSAAGFALSVRDNRLVISPFSRLSEQQRGYLHANKAALVSLLEDAETLHHALVVAGHAGLGWQEGTPNDWPDTRLLAAGELLYGDGRIVSAHGRRYAIDSAPAIEIRPEYQPADCVPETASHAATDSKIAVPEHLGSAGGSTTVSERVQNCIVQLKLVALTQNRVSHLSV